MSSADRLYNLLPTIYRQKDLALEHSPLRDYLAVMETELQTLETDIAALYDNWFIETCDDWVIPYIGDLLGIRGLDTSNYLGANLRTQVANTLKLRSSKGTAAALAQAATAGTGWPALAVEYFELLSKTQPLNYQRLDQGQLANIRQQKTLDLIGTPFDQVAHSADMHVPPTEPAVSNAPGKYNIANLGLFLWRLKSYPVQWAKAYEVSTQTDCYTFNPFGVDIPLFDSPAAYPTSPPMEITNLDTLQNAPPPNTFLSASSVSFLNPDKKSKILKSKGIQLFFQHSDATTLHAITNQRIYIGDLSQWQSSLSAVLLDQVDQALTANAIANDSHDIDEVERIIAIVDPKLGRIVLCHRLENQSESSDDNLSIQLWVNYAYGFSANVGGGPYRQPQPGNGGVNNTDFQAIVSQTADFSQTDTSDGVIYSNSLTEVFSAWKQQQQNGTILITDSGRYCLESFADGDDGDGADETPQDKQHALEILAAPGQCPCLVGDLEVTGCFAGSQLTLQGLWIDGTIKLSGTINLIIQDCTIAPPKTNDDGNDLSIQVINTQAADDTNVVNDFDNSHLQIEITRSLLGPISTTAHHVQLQITDSIVDAGTGVAIAGSSSRSDGTCLSIERTTVIGETRVNELCLADAVIFTQPVKALSTQGFIRYSYLPHEQSVTPQRYRCQPDLTLEGSDQPLTIDTVKSEMRPQFTSLRYGDPGYGQLSLQTPTAILTGAENGSEMGVFSNLHQPQKLANLSKVLDEYLPYGLEMGLFYVD